MLIDSRVMKVLGYPEVYGILEERQKATLTKAQYAQIKNDVNSAL